MKSWNRDDELEQLKLERCPECGSEQVRIIVYGVMEKNFKLDQSKFVLGGCIVGPGNRYCASCGNEWFNNGRTAKGQPAPHA